MNDIGDSVLNCLYEAGKFHKQRWFEAVWSNKNEEARRQYDIVRAIRLRIQKLEKRNVEEKSY